MHASAHTLSGNVIDWSYDYMADRENIGCHFHSIATSQPRSEVDVVEAYKALST